MKIDKIKINGFGKIKERELKFKEGINIIYGGNESGKSTILKGIQAILYGISKNKNGKNISDLERYQPWEDFAFSGKIQYNLDNGEEYEVFREFKKKNPIIYQNNEDVSKTFSIDKTKGIQFLETQVGMDEATFCHTAIIGQQEVKLAKADSHAIVQKISNLVSSGDDTISFKKSMDKLNKWQNETIGTDRTKGKPINVVDDNIKNLVSQKRDLQWEKEKFANYSLEQERITDELEKLQNQKEKLKSTRQSLNDKEIKKVEIKMKRKVCIFVALLLAVLAVLLVMFRQFVLAVFSVLIVILDVFIIFKMSQIQKENSDFDQNKIEKEMEKLEAKINDLKLKSRVLETEKANLDEKLEILARIEENLEGQKCLKEELLSLEVSYNIAKQALSQAYEEIKHNLSPKFEQKLCEITAELTNGRYKKVMVNDENGLLVEVENGAYMPVERLSIGTIDEMYLALRLSILSEVSKENLPIFLDETFAYFDELRLKNMLCYLQDKNYNNQIFIFTCTNREEEILKQLKIEYHLIKLEN